jgi:signal transduction histidine kinase
MFQILYAKAPFVIVGALVAFFCLAVAAQFGASFAHLTLIAFGFVTLGSLALLIAAQSAMAHNQRHTRQVRFIAERFQSMLRALPGGYCLFTPQGLLRESHGVAERLGAEKIAHFDEIVAQIKEGADLIPLFRKLQMTGAGFTFTAHAAAGGKALQIAGMRFRVGSEGPQVDMLWFGDVAVPAALAEAALKPALESGQICDTACLQFLIDAMPFPVWARAQDLQLSLCNKAYASALDSTPRDAIGQQIELNSQTARGGSGRTLAANALAKKELQRERRHVIIDGKRRLLEINEIPLEDGAAQKILGYALDVTVEEEKETELQRHQAAHHEVMEHLGSAIAIYGADMKLEFYNRAYQRLWDSPENFLDGKPTFGEVLEDLRTRRRLPEQADFQRYKKDRLGLFTSLLEPQEDLMYLPDGTTLRILAAPHPFGGLIFVHEDVTDRLALESSYNTLIAVQRETLDNLAEGIAVFGADGKLRLSNPAFARIWKLSHEFLGSEPHIADLLEHMKPLFAYGANWAAFKADMVRYTLDRNPRTGRIERADQEVVEFSTLPLPDGAILNAYLDVTDSARVEQALRASNEALATADRLKSDFVANVSYQLRTPLNTITGFADILAAQYFGTLNERQMEYTATIKSESEKLTRLINDVLDLAMIEAGRMAVERQTLDVADLLNDAKQIAAPWARQQGLAIVIDCPSDIGKIDADPHRLKQVLFNLIGNAVKYTPKGGRVTMSAAREGGNLALRVSDTGIGIPEVDRERVFGKFERANLQTRQSGVGLGLSLVKSFIELHGGRVEIESDVKTGTTVSCFIPEKASAESETPPALAARDADEDVDA